MLSLSVLCRMSLWKGLELEPYRLTDVRVTERELERGFYTTILELEYMGLKCAGKKIREAHLSQGDSILQFDRECRILSQIRHPNIVQFLGVYFQEGVQVPILVMELLPNNLTSCIEQYNILPENVSYSILYDVALGLCYLHSQRPPIIHRDISSNNVLLTSNMTAKIADFGLAKILTSTYMTQTSETSGTPAYMPPEAMVAYSKYDTSIDEFSYGILIIHVFSGKWPEPQLGPVVVEADGSLTPLSEAERRESLLQSIGKEHPLMPLILKCIENRPSARTRASEIVEQLAKMTTPLDNRLDMLRHAEEEGKTTAEATAEATAKHDDEVRHSHLLGELETLQSELRDRDAEIRKLRNQIEMLQQNVGVTSRTLSVPSSIPMLECATTEELVSC